MVLPIVKYGHPALRQKGAPLESITPDIQALIDDMLETMHQAAGIGLAAQQVGKALQLTVIDVRDITDRPSTLEVDGQPTEVQSAMPLILINPKIQPTGNPSTGPEGCLSFPEIYADITRPEAVTVSASNRNGEPLRLKAGGLLSRVIQHEVDHLNGILFIDRMSSAVKSELKPQLEELRQATQAALQGKTN
jgi:peptide deformylase